MGTLVSLALFYFVSIVLRYELDEVTRDSLLRLGVGEWPDFKNSGLQSRAMDIVHSYMRDFLDPSILEPLRVGGDHAKKRDSGSSGPVVLVLGQLCRSVDDRRWRL